METNIKLPKMNREEFIARLKEAVKRYKEMKNKENN